MSENKRLTLDLDPEDHAQLKQLCAILGMSMREFLIEALHQELEKAEEMLDRKSANEVKKAIRKGRETLSEWSDVEKRIGWNKL